MRLEFDWTSKARAVAVAGMLASIGTLTTAAGEFSCTPSVRQIAWSELTTQTFNYDAYGQLVGGNPTDTEYAFTGEDGDNDVGAYYLRARWYRPDWGRFLSRDTYEGDLEEPITQNRFLYGVANPVLFVDSSGHENAQMQISGLGVPGNLAALRQVGVTVAKHCGARILACIGAKRVLTSGPVQHIFTNKNRKAGGQYTSAFEKFFGMRGLNLSDLLDKVIISGHVGPHSPEKYHDVIKRMLERAAAPAEKEAMSLPVEQKKSHIKKAIHKMLLAIVSQVCDKKSKPGAEIKR